MKKLIAVTMLAALLVGAMAAAGSAYFTTEVKTTVVGRTGYVQLTAPCKVILPDDMQPGHRWVRKLVLRNVGRCPVRVTIRLVGIPWFLNANVSPGSIGNLLPGHSRTITLHVNMPSSIGNPAQNKPVHFLIYFYGRNN